MLLERDTDLAAAEATLAEVVTLREGRLLLVEGLPGIGKTQLLKEIARRADGSGMQVLDATGGELELELPFGIARQLLIDDVVGHDGTPAAAAALGLDVDRQPPEARAAELDALDGLFRMCASRAAQSPLLLLVDDVHWADSASVKFLLYVVRRMSGLPVAVVIAARPAAMTSRSPELDLLLEHADLTLRLEPLSAASTASVVRAWFDQAANESFTRVCVETTGGNPLLLRQLLEEATAEGLQPEEEQAARLRELGSTTVARSALLRVSRLGRAAVDVAASVALLGRRATLPLVAAIAEVSTEEAELVLDGLVDAHIIKQGQPLRFVHPLVQSAIYRHMPDGLRSRRHRESARLLALFGAPDDEIARHLLRSAPSGDAWVYGQLRTAGFRALETGAPDVAATLLRRALEEEPPSARDPNLLLRVGQAEALIRDRAALGHLQEAFDLCAEPAQRAQVALPLARALAYRRRYADALAVLDAALESVDPEDRETTLRLGSERLWMLESSDLSVADFVRSAQDLARDVTGETHGERLALSHLGTARLFLCTPHVEVRELAHRALGDGQLLREEGPDSPSWLYAASLLWVVGDYAAAEHEMLRGEQVAFDRGTVAPLVSIHGVRAWVSCDLGELDRAERLARDVLTRTHGQSSTGARYARSCLATVLIERGLLDDAEVVLDEAEPATEALDRFDALLLHAKAELRLARGDRGGIDDLLDVGGWCDNRGIQNPGEWAWRSDVAPHLAAAGEVEMARRLANEDLDRARQFGVPRPLGRALHACALVAEPADRLPLLAEAVEVLTDSPARLATAKALVHLGVALRAGGRVGEAQQSFRHALDLATACGGTPVAEDAHRLLLSTGARPRRTAVIGPAALTRSEREVADLAADGLTNREIAARLYVSVKAVEKHLRNAFAKLAIERRTALAEALSEPVERVG